MKKPGRKPTQADLKCRQVVIHGRNRPTVTQLTALLQAVNVDGLCPDAREAVRRLRAAMAKSATRKTLPVPRQFETAKAPPMKTAPLKPPVEYWTTTGDQPDDRGDED